MQLGRVFQDLAAVRAGTLLVDTASYADIKQRLEPLTAPDRAFRHSARSMLALAAWRAKDTAAMRKWTDMVLADARYAVRRARPGANAAVAVGRRQEELRTPMRCRRVFLIASLLAVGVAVSGCETFDPTEWFNPKKPLPGERKEVFPGGVPGVPEGVPPELMKGYQPPAEPAPQPLSAAREAQTQAKSEAQAKAAAGCRTGAARARRPAAATRGRVRRQRAGGAIPARGIALAVAATDNDAAAPARRIAIPGPAAAGSFSLIFSS